MIDLGRTELGSTGRALARSALAGAVAGTPLLVAAPAANAASDEAWDRLAQCESGGDWSINTGNGYYGGVQFLPATWEGFGGTEFAASAHEATKAEQIVVAERVLAEQGWNAWPACSAKTGVRGESATQRGAPDSGSSGESEADESESSDSGTSESESSGSESSESTSAQPASVDSESDSESESESGGSEQATDSAPAATDGDYVVQRGDTLSRIAEAENVEGGWQTLVAKNPELAADPDLIHPGQRLAM